MLPNKKDETWHNPFYSDIRSNNIEHLDKLIKEWPYNLEELDEVLASAYEELKLKNVLLENKTEIFIESKIINLRFFSNTSRHDQSFSDVDLNNTGKRIELILESIRLLKIDYSNTRKVDGKFIFLAKCIAKNIHVLKQQLKSNQANIPWEQMEFCLAIFISSYIKRQEMNLYYRATLNKRTILHHLENFANILEVCKRKLHSSEHEQVVTQIINSYPQFYELYKDNQQIRDVKSLLKISNHIQKSVLSANPTKKDGQLIITKALQLIDEYSKSTLEFSKLVSNNTATSDQENTREKMVDLRNSLLAISLSNKSRTVENRDLNFFLNVHEDIKKVGYEMPCILNELNTNKAEIFVKNKLISLRSYVPSSEKDSSDKNTQIKLILQSISWIKENYCNTKEVEEQIIFETKSIAQNISKIKRQLKSKYDKLAWEEMEFCLTSFVTSYTKPQEMNQFYRAFLNKFRILSHLENFAKKIEDGNFESEPVVTKRSCPEFEELYKDYQQIRDVHYLRKISDNIKLALSTNPKERNGLLIIIRVLQVIGEHLKNTKGSPKLSDNISGHLLLSLRKKTRSILRELRDLLSHDDNDSLSKRTEIEKKLDDTFFFNIKNDMKKVGNAITDILYINEIEIIRILLEQIVACENSDEINEVAELFTTVQFDEMMVLEYFNIMDHENFEKVLKEFNDAISDKTDFEEDKFNNIEDLLKCTQSRSEDLSSAYDDRVNKLKKVIDSLAFIKHDKPDQIKLIKNLAYEANEALLTTTSGLDSKRRKVICGYVELIFQCVMKRKPCYPQKLGVLMSNIQNIIEFETGNIKWIEKFTETLNEKGSIISAKEENNNQRKMYKVTEEKYKNQLAVKLFELKRLLSEHSLRSSKPEKLFFYKSDKKTQAIVEMHLLDIMAILDNSKNYLENNLLFLDDNAPLLNGKCLRNHLAHDNALFDVLLSDPSMAVILNAEKLTEKNISEARNKIGKLVKDDPFKLKEKYNRDLFVITNQERMFVALEDGNIDTLNECLKKGADVKARSINSWTTLHFAAKGSSLEVVEFITSLLLLNSRCISIPDESNGQNPLHIAAAHGRTSIVECFIRKYSFEVDNVDKRFQTPLHLAVQNGHKDTVEVLLQYKANANSQDACDRTPVDYAILYNHTDVAKILLQTGKNFENKSIYNYTPLHYAAQCGNLDLVNFLLENNVQVNAKTEREEIALHLAASFGFQEIVHALIVKGADVNATTIHNYTSLHYAIERGHKDIVNILLKHTDNVNAINSSHGNSHLHCAVEFGHLEIVKTLLKNGAAVNVPNIEGKTPLHFAAYFGHSEICNDLLEHGVIIDARDINNNTPLHCAAQWDYIEVAALLIKNEADLNPKSSDGKTPLHIAATLDHKGVIYLLIRKNAEVNTKDTDGETPLHAAARNGNKDVIDILLKNKAEVNAITNDGYTTALHEAAFEGHVDATEILIRNGADVNAGTDVGYTPLNAGVAGGHKDVVKILTEDNVRAFAVINNHKFPDNLKFQALMFAVYKGHTDIVKILLENEDNVNMPPNIENINMLHLAVFQGHKEIVQILIKKGVDPNSIGIFQEYLFTPLCLASQKGYEEIVEILIAGGADVNLPLDTTPLHIAAEMGHSTVVNALIRHKVDINVKDSSGSTAVEIAVRCDHLQVVKMLLQDNKLLDKEAKVINGCTLLHIASTRSNLQMVKYLVDEGFDIHAKNVYGGKPMHIAAARGRKDIVDYFLRMKGLSINDTDASNTTLLHYAAVNGHLEVINYLIVHGADVNAKNDDGLTTLHVAAQFGCKDAIQVLLKNGAIYNAVDQFGREPIEMTTDQEIINLLTSTV